MTTATNDKPATVDAEVIHPVATVDDKPAPTKGTVATAQQQREEQVNVLFSTAYNQASQLKLTDDEAQRLTAPFPDDMVDILPAGHLYIEHMTIRERLFAVLGPGQWCHLKRWHTLETLGEGKDTKKRIYAESVLIVRGVAIAETVTHADWHANNPQQSMSDALESAMSDALRRLASKGLGVGSQVWHRGYAEQWKAKHAGRETRDGKLIWVKTTAGEGQKTADKPAAKAAEKPAETKAAVGDPPITKEQSEYLLTTWKGHADYATALLPLLGVERYGLVTQSMWNFVRLCIDKRPEHDRVTAALEGKTLYQFNETQREYAARALRGLLEGKANGN